MVLRILPGNIANMIAAGEVVQRPASVVKELMENAVDAGATSVNVVITDAGRTLVQVIDNGCGMTPDDAVLCFERHATSKIATAEDLERITTYGFRGEALASIAAVSQVTLRTRTADAEVGCQVEFAASQHASTTEAAVPQGTNIAVRNLFYNVPARRKFLKSDNVEFRHIVEEFTKVALTRPDIAFTLSHNGKDIHSLAKAKSLKFRILDLLGTQVAGDVVDVSAATSVVRLSGFAGRPDAARKTPGQQFFFVNGRHFRSAYLHKAVLKAYEGMLPEGAVPAYFLYLEVDPQTVDVNISPTKSEVKFEDESFVFQVVFAAVKETLGKNAFAATIDFSNPEEKDMPVLGSHFAQYRPDAAPRVDIDPSYNPFEPLEPSPGSGGGKRSQDVFSGYDPGHFVDAHEDYGALFEERAATLSQLILLDGKYIVTPVQEGLMVVNIRRARERVLYDRALSALRGMGHVTQTGMFPVKVQVGVEHRLLFDEKAPLLASLGFDISPLGDDTVVVNGVPEGFSAEKGKVRTMVDDLLLILSDDSASLPEMMETAMAGKMALLGAAGADKMTSPVQARNLLEALLSCENAELTSRGLRILQVIPFSQIEKGF